MELTVNEVTGKIRTLGLNSPGTYRAFFAELSSFVEIDGTPKTSEIAKILTKVQEQVVKTCRTELKTTQAANQEPSIALIPDRMKTYKKTAWMLRDQYNRNGQRFDFRFSYEINRKPIAMRKTKTIS